MKLQTKPDKLTPHFSYVLAVNNIQPIEPHGFLLNTLHRVSKGRDIT